ncbi:hypothetical protein AX17_002261 [Amanita inopinata Kibby_2008]|nr:hypothetical protein AX17_002261 [Amanita inopinata Kibby_2008]
MLLREFRRQVLKLTKAKVIYTRITLTPVTLFYFLLAFTTCIILVSMQAVTFSDNSTAANILSGIVAKANVTQGLPVYVGGVLQYCDRIPGESRAKCMPLVSSATPSNGGDGDEASYLTWRRDLRFQAAEVRYTDSLESSGVLDWVGDSRHKQYRRGASRRITSNPTQPDDSINPNCAKAFRWLEETLNDARREDVVTLCFEFWLLSLATVTIVNESLPHLGASLLGHALGTGWAGYRIRSSYALMDRYYKDIVVAACNNVDPLGDWWNVRNNHAIPIVVANAIALVFMLFLSCKLYKVYSTQTFGLVGASSKIERILKIVFLFSVSLQLTAFFTIASAAVWTDKVTNGTISFLAKHIKAYLAGFIVTLVLVIPWFVTGWVCVRRECQWRFMLFCTMSVFLLSVPTIMFWSTLYRFIFTSWPFFATITLTAYIFVVITSILAIWCRFNFGQGLAHFLQVSDVLENMDFPPVFFSKEGDTENGVTKEVPITISSPPLAPPSRATLSPLRRTTFLRRSVYSDNNVGTIKMSTSVPLFSEVASTVLFPSSPTSESMRASSIISAKTTKAAQKFRNALERRSVMSTKSAASASVPVSVSQGQGQNKEEEGNDNGGSSSSNSNSNSRNPNNRGSKIGGGRRGSSSAKEARELVSFLDLTSPKRRRPLPTRPLPKPPRELYLVPSAVSTPNSGGRRLSNVQGS